MQASSLPLIVLAAALGLSLTGCDSTSSKKEASQAHHPSDSATSASNSAPAATATSGAAPVAPAKASNVALPAGLKVGRWQGFILAQRHAMHFVLDVALENNRAVAYLLNEGPNGQERLRCGPVRAAGDSAIIGLPGTSATLTIRANGEEHLAGAWVQPASRLAFSAIYGEPSALRVVAATPNVAGTWRVSFKGRTGNSRSAVLLCQQQGAKLLAALSGPGGTFRYLSGAALPDGLGIASFDGRSAVLLQAQKLPNGTLKGHFYSGKGTHETWTALPAPQADFPKD